MLNWGYVWQFLTMAVAFGTCIGVAFDSMWLGIAAYIGVMIHVALVLYAHTPPDQR